MMVNGTFLRARRIATGVMMRPLRFSSRSAASGASASRSANAPINRGRRAERMMTKVVEHAHEIERNQQLILDDKNLQRSVRGALAASMSSVCSLLSSTTRVRTVSASSGFRAPSIARRR